MNISYISLRVFSHAGGGFTWGVGLLVAGKGWDWRSFQGVVVGGLAPVSGGEGLVRTPGLPGR